MFCMEDKVQHQATVCSLVWVSTVSPPLLQSRNLDLDREQTSNSNAALTLKWAEVRTVLSWRGDGTQARSPCSLEYTGWHGQRGPAPGGLQTGRPNCEKEDDLLFAMSGRLRPVPQTDQRWRWRELPGRGAAEGGHHQQSRDHLDPGGHLHHHHCCQYYHHDDDQLLDCPRLDLELRDQNGRTALHVACWYNKVSMKRKGRCTLHQIPSRTNA